MKKYKGKVELEINAKPELHELKTAYYLANLGYTVKFLEISRQKSIKNPDIEMNHLLWEIKSPIGKSSRVIENNLRKALRQSSNIIFDLRRTNKNIESKSRTCLKNEFKKRKQIKNLLIISRKYPLIILVR